MKQMYWTRSRIPVRVVTVIAVFAVVGLCTVEVYRQQIRQPYSFEKLAAARLAKRAMGVLKTERIRRGYAIDPQIDPARTGLIGLSISPVTSISGHLESKQLSINPDFSAVVLDLLARANVVPGDCIAVGYSGSFPALNLCVGCAIEQLRLKPVVIASASASQYGANMPDFMWLDMEQTLHAHRLISFRAVAASPGGYEDRALGMTDQGRDLVQAAIERNNVQFIDSTSFQDAIDRRMSIYDRHARDRPIKAYVNVGGGTISVGRSLGKKLYQPGLNMVPPPGALRIDSVMTRFMKREIPVIHLVEIDELHQQYKLAVAQDELPSIGRGSAYAIQRYNRWLAGVIFIILAASLPLCAIQRNQEIRPPNLNPAPSPQNSLPPK